MICVDSEACYFIYNLHTNSSMSLEEKIEKLVNKYEVLKGRRNWETIEGFFKNSICVRESYNCETYSNLGNGTFANKYIESDISHEEAIKKNIYFYMLLSVLGEKQNIIAYTANYLSYSDKTELYLNKYAEKHNLCYEKDGREVGRYLIRIMHECVESEEGHDIYRCIELPI